MVSLDTVVLGGATHSESESCPTTRVSTLTPGWKFIMESLWYQKTNCGVTRLSRSSQLMVTLSPRLTCFSLDPRIEAEGLFTHSQEVRVFTPDAVAAWVGL